VAVSAGIPRLRRELVAAYLRRLGFDGEQPPTAAVLAHLHRAHLERVPFENLDIHLGIPIHLDAHAFAEKVGLHGRGGFCYELNGAFAALLTALGFDIELLEARVHSPSGLGGRFGHLCLAVRFGGKRMLADVGFGRGCFDEPISLVPGVAQVDTAGAFALRDAPDRARARSRRLRSGARGALRRRARRQRDRVAHAVDAHRARGSAQPLMMLRTGATLGCPGSAPRSAMIGRSVAPNASNAACDSQTSNTWIRPSLSRATW
jgi:arylamine N-acetyltransferase